VEPNLGLSRQLATVEIDHITMENRFQRKDGGYLWSDFTVTL
jgi:hypothetical protein